MYSIWSCKLTPGKQGQMEWEFFEDHLVNENGKWKRLIVDERR